MYVIKLHIVMSRTRAGTDRMVSLYTVIEIDSLIKNTEVRLEDYDILRRMVVCFVF